MILIVGAIAIGLTLLATLLWISPFDLPGPLDELFVSALAIISWIWFGSLLIDKVKELFNNETFMISFIAISVIILGLLMIRAYIRREK